MINTNFIQGAFKRGDELVIIDPCNQNNWGIVLLLDNYGITRDINVIYLYDSVWSYEGKREMDTQFVDMFLGVYKIVREFC